MGPAVCGSVSGGLVVGWFDESRYMSFPGKCLPGQRVEYTTLGKISIQKALGLLDCVPPVQKSNYCLKHRQK